MDEYLKINSTDGKSRMYDTEGNLVSIDGVKVKKDIPVISEKIKEEVKNNGNVK